jgi:ABC-type polysaccharide/polyol phosphate transport system ATPase subunit
VEPGPTTPPAIAVDRVSKRFVIPHEKQHTIKERVLHPLSRPGSDRFTALEDVSFAVGRGEFFGIVGRNGSGKSTLLKCLAGIYGTDEGEIYVDGRTSTFIELGVGFNNEMAARDNVRMNAIMLGLSPREADACFDRVIEFAELEEFVDLKLKNYSSGMQVRLAFSVMVQVNAEILLIDEILAVGDAAFQQKCFDEFFKMRDQGKTVVFVTHDMAAVERFCHRAMLVERGEIVTIGEPSEVADRELNFASGGPGDSFGGSMARAGDGAARVQEAWLEDGHGARATVFAQGSPCVFKATVRFERAVEDPSFDVAFVTAQHQNVFVASTRSEGERTGRFEAGETATFSLSFTNVLAPGRYAISTVVAHPGGGDALMDRWERHQSIMVTGARPAGGLVDLQHELSLERGAPVA